MAGKKRKSKTDNNKKQKKQTVVVPPEILFDKNNNPISHPDLLDQSGDEIPTSFPSLSAIDELKTLTVDLGSSFTKMGSTAMYKDSNGNTLVSSNSIRFNSSKEQQYARSIIYYQDGKYHIEGRQPKEAVELHSIKKFLTVKDLETVELHDITFSVSTIMYNLIKCLLSDACLSKEVIKFDSIVFTIPTGSSEHSKKILRNCIKKAFSEVFPNHPKLDDSKIFIVEEYRLLSLCTDRGPLMGQCNKLLMVDIGHLTLDLAVLERTDGGYWTSHPTIDLTHWSSEVVGTELIHQAIQKRNIDAFKLMSSLYSSGAESLYDSSLELNEDIIEDLDNEIFQAVLTMMIPIFEVYLERQIEKVVIFGAITDQPYLKQLITKALNKYDKFVAKRKKNLNSSFIPKDTLPKIQYSFFECSRTALIQGVEQLIRKAKLDNVRLCHNRTSTTQQEEEYQSIPGVLLSTTVKAKKKNRTTSYNQICLCHQDYLTFDMKKHQDIELFVFRFRKTTDLSKVKLVGTSNYDKIGLFHCERHSTIMIEFCEEIVAMGTEFCLKVDLKTNTLLVRYLEHANLLEKSFPINRDACIERVSLCEINEVLTKDESSVNQNWYGRPVRETFTIGLNEGNPVNDN